MASIWKDPRTDYLQACFSAVVGSRLVQWKRSTLTADRKQARRIADALEEAAQGRQDTDAVKSFLEGIPDLRARRGLYRTFDDVLKKTGGRGIEGKSARAFVESWIERTQGEVSPATWAKYDRTARIFLDSLGPKADQDMGAIAREEIARFRDVQGKRVSASTANLALKIVRVIFAAAEQDGVVTRNEARNVKRLKTEQSANKRRAFTLPELRRLLAVADPEWHSLVLFGFYTGARLGDLAGLTWQNIDLERDEVAYSSRKTSRTVIVPLSRALRAHIEKMEAGDDPSQPLHPRAFAFVEKEGRVSTLSRQFSEIMVNAGLLPKRSHKAAKGGKGRSARRVTTALSFHALRHTAVSLLKSAGVSDAIARDLAGHESAAVSRLYTHIEDSAKREAVNRLPSLKASKR